MIKLFFTGMIIYGIYKFFIAPANPPLKDAPSNNTQAPQEKKSAKDADGEYIEYEEVD